MKRNTLLQSIGFADQDHKNARHDAALHFIKQPHILKKIIEQLQLNYPSFIESLKKGYGFEKVLPLQKPFKIIEIKNIKAESEVLLSKGKTIDTKYTIGFMDGVIEYDIEFEVNVHRQLDHQKVIANITQEELTQIQEKKHPFYLSAESPQQIYYTKDSVLYSKGVNGTFLTCKDDTHLYWTKQQTFINKKGEEYKEPIPWLYTLAECELKPQMNFVPYKIVFDHVFYELHQDGYFHHPEFTDQLLQIRLSKEEGALFPYHISQTNTWLQATCCIRQWELQTIPLSITGNMIRIETKFHPTPASDIVRQIKLYEDYLPITKKPWIVVTFYPFSCLEQHELKLAGLHWIHLGGQDFEKWFIEQNAQRQPAQLFF